MLRPLRVDNSEKAAFACAWVRTHGFDYLDGELDPAERQAVETHLKSCAACRREIALCRQSENALSTALSVVPSAGDLRPEFYARLAATSAARPRWSGWRVAVLAPAACALAIFLLRPAPTSPTKAPFNPTPESMIAGTRKPDRSNSLSLSPTGNKQKSVELADNAPAERDVPPMLEIRSVGERKLRSLQPHSRRARLQRELPAVPLRMAAPPLQLAATVEAGETSDYARVELKSEVSWHAYRLAYTPESRPTTYAYVQTPSAATVKDEVSLRVQDDVRGFTASTRIAGKVQERDDGQVLTIEADGNPGEEAAPDSR